MPPDDSVITGRHCIGLCTVRTHIRRCTYTHKHGGTYTLFLGISHSEALSHLVVIFAHFLIVLQGQEIKKKLVFLWTSGKTVRLQN